MDGNGKEFFDEEVSQNVKKKTKLTTLISRRHFKTSYAPKSSLFYLSFSFLLINIFRINLGNELLMSKHFYFALRAFQEVSLKRQKKKERKV
jgi:hypothetical protein